MNSARRLVTTVFAAPILLAAATAPSSIPSWGVSQDDYPREALRGKMEGTTRFEVAVSETGAPVRCSIIKSSGHDILDQKTCEVVMGRAKFKPARDDAGAAIPGTIRHLVVWSLPQSGSAQQARLPYAGYAVTVTFNAVGDVTKCQVASLSASLDLPPNQANQCNRLGTATVFSELMGRPSAGLATATFRLWLVDRRYGPRLRTDQEFRREPAHVVFDRADDGAITWCEVALPPATPAVGFDAGELCGPNGYGVTRPNGGGHAQDLFVDVVAKTVASAVGS